MSKLTREGIIQKRGYDESIHGDALSLKIASYPVAARYLAQRLARNGDSICELCCGIGVSLVEFSKYFDTVIGVDSDPLVIETAKRNLTLYGSSNCRLVLGDITDKTVIKNINTDIIVYDIPYWSDHGGIITTENPELLQLVSQIEAEVTRNIVIHTPPQTGIEYFETHFDEFEFRQVWIDGNHDRNLVFLGSTTEQGGLQKIALTNT